MQAERFTRFPEHKQGDTPLNLWERMHPSIPNPRSETYVSTPLTSGPAKTYIATREPYLSAGEVTLRSMNANRGFLDTVLAGFPDQNDTRLTIPYHIGKRNGWEEWGYNSFWMHYLSGISPQEAEVFGNEVAREKIVQEDVFNDHAAPKAKRLGEYQKFVDAYGDFIKSVDLNPVSTVIFMPGYEDSLGCTAEKMLAERLHIRQMFVIFDSSHATYGEQIGQGAPWLEGHPQIKENGGERLIFFASSL